MKLVPKPERILTKLLIKFVKY